MNRAIGLSCQVQLINIYIKRVGAAYYNPNRFCKMLPQHVIFPVDVYIKSSALAKKVVLKGSTILQYEPIGDCNTMKNAATDIKNNTQKSPVFFLVVSIYLIFCKYRSELFILYILQILC